jgi:hypothetical protein
MDGLRIAPLTLPLEDPGMWNALFPVRGLAFNIRATGHRRGKE